MMHELKVVVSSSLVDSKQVLCSPCGRVTAYKRSSLDCVNVWGKPHPALAVPGLGIPGQFLGMFLCKSFT